MTGRIISHYRITEKLGGGAMGVVYKAEDTRLKRTVALKFLAPELTREPDARERFVQEAQAASALDHVNICTIHEIDETEDGHTFIAMAYYQGETLKKKIEQGALPVEQAVEMAIQVAQGLERAHEEGIIHRDIKPANAMVTRGDRASQWDLVKIVDFGLAKVAAGVALTKTGRSVGTPAYMSPEQARGEAVDMRTDVWSLGVVLYEMLTGERPFRGDYEHAVIYSIINQDLEPLAVLRPEVPEALAEVVHRALEKDPEARYASMAAILEDLKAFQTSLQPAGVAVLDVKALLRQPRVVISALVVLLVLGALGVWWINRGAQVRWAREVALPEIEQLAQNIPWSGNGPNGWAAYELATEAGQFIPNNLILNRLWPRVSRAVTIYSDPPGARVYAKPYAAVEADWRYLGQTPIDSIRLPLGVSRINLEMEGFQRVEDLLQYRDTLRFTLPEAGSLPEHMVRVPGSLVKLRTPGIDHLDREKVEDFLMDRYEVTNEAYKHFVDSGGYDKREYWKHPFVKEGRRLLWEEAMTLFKDKTGRPGPATWEVGDYPDNEDDYPVTGVSWYEAAAYAEFVGKSLPTIYHWKQAAYTLASSEIIPSGNFNDEGPVPVGSHHALNRYGTHDLAGNAREWTLNESSRNGQRFIMGGGWNDPAYAFNDAYAQPAFDRSPTNGFRCIQYLAADANFANLSRTIELPFRDFLGEEPVSDETFEGFLSQYAYDKTELNAVIESQQEEEDWVRQKITFDAAYGNERMIAHLFLPKQSTPPYQAVVFFPGSNAIHERSSEMPLETRPIDLGAVHFLLKSGRAVVYPVYKGTFERGDELDSDYPEETVFYKEHVIMWAKDLGRSIDYLETRDDINTDKLAYYGFSWGGFLGGIMPAVEKRFKVSVLNVAGIFFQRALPEADAVNFLPRVTIPVLMLTGRYDFFFPVETSQRPMSELLGTPEKDKDWKVYEGSHFVPKDQLIRETLAWLDKYLGPI